MGQHHLPINFTKREYFSPHRLGDGLKLLEQSMHTVFGGTMTALHVLLAASTGRGGGDYPADTEVTGRWAGDSIAMIGDYSESGDVPAAEGMEKLAFNLCQPLKEIEDVLDRMRKSVKEDQSWADPQMISMIEQQIESQGPFTDISLKVRDYLEREFGGLSYSIPDYATKEPVWMDRKVS